MKKICSALSTLSFVISLGYIGGLDTMRIDYVTGTRMALLFGLFMATFAAISKYLGTRRAVSCRLAWRKKGSAANQSHNTLLRRA